MFQDYLFFGSDVESRYVYRMANLTSLVRYAQKLHGLSNSRACFLGETFLSCMLLSSILEDEERFNLRIKIGNQFLASAETTLFAEIKGFIECEEGTAFVNKLDANEKSVAEFQVRSLRAVPERHQLHEGSTLFETDNVQDAINDHLVRSFQMMSELRVQCWIDPKDNLPRAFGVIYMELPDIDVDVAKELWDNVDALPTLQKLLEQSDDPDTLASRLIPHKTHPIRSLNPRWSCTCSRGAVEGMLLKIPSSELVDMMQKAEPVEVKCHFCNQAYVISLERIRELAANAQLAKDENASGVKN